MSARRDRTQPRRIQVEVFLPPKTDRGPVQKIYRLRCNRCRQWSLPGTVGGRVLGLDSFCAVCVDELALECQKANEGRLPTRDVEFYCPHCRAIHPLDVLTAPDRDGRRRWICWPCRQKQVAKAVDLRQRRRAKA